MEMTMPYYTFTAVTPTNAPNITLNVTDADPELRQQLVDLLCNFLNELPGLVRTSYALVDLSSTPLTYNQAAAGE